MYYPCSENKGADQLRGYREADLRLCFRICKEPVFSRRGSYIKDIRILHDFVVGIDLSVPNVTFWHDETRPVMPDSYLRDRLIGLILSVYH